MAAAWVESLHCMFSTGEAALAAPATKGPIRQPTANRHWHPLAALKPFSGCTSGSLFQRLISIAPRDLRLPVESGQRKVPIIDVSHDATGYPSIKQPLQLGWMDLSLRVVLADEAADVIP